MNYKFVVIVVFSLFSFFGCATEEQAATSQNIESYQSAANRPEWIMSGKDAAFPEPRYVTGVGLSKETDNPVADRRAADQSAISEVLQQIVARVSSDISVERVEMIGDKVQTNFERTVANSRVRTSLTITGLTIAERYYDPEAKLFYSLAVLDRIEASATLYQVLKQYVADFRERLAESRNELTLGEVNQSLLSLKAAIQTSSKFEDMLPQFRILATPEMLADSLTANPPSAALVLNKMTNYLSRLNMSIVSGDKQQFILGKPLRVPLSVRVTVDSGGVVPVLPVAFRFEAGRGQVTSNSTTVSTGIATAIVENVERANVPVYTIAAEVGFQRLSDTASYAVEWNKLLSSGDRKVLFEFKRKRAPYPLKVLILLDRSGGSKTAQAVLSEEFSEVGFSSVTESDIGSSNIKVVLSAVRQAQFDRLRTRFPGKFDLIVVGDISASPLSNVEGLKIYLAKGSIKAFSVSNGVNMGADSFENVRGFGNTTEQANENAIRNGASDAAEKIIGDILSKY